MTLPDINVVGHLAWAQAVRDSGGLASDGPIADFANGWAKLGFIGDKTHYWRPARGASDAIGPRGRVKLLRSLCQLDGTTTEQVPAFKPGNYPRCRHCQRQANKLRLS